MLTNEAMTFEAIMQYLKENCKVVNITNSEIHIDGCDRSFMVEHESGISLKWGKSYLSCSTIKPENLTGQIFHLYLNETRILSYEGDTYTTTFDCDNFKLHEIHKMLDSPRLTID